MSGLLLSGWTLPGQPANPALLQRTFEEGERALAEKRYADAEAAYQRLRQLDPGAAELHAKLGVIYFQQGKFAPAVPALRQALKLKPGLANASILLAMCLSELGRYAEALPGLEKGFRQPADLALQRMSGLQLLRAYNGLQRDRQAVETALELTRLYPEDPEILYHSSRQFGNQAYLTLRKLAEVAPNSVWRHQAAGEAHESQGQHDLALLEYRQALALDPRRPGLHYRLGRVLLARSRQADPDGEARKEFEQELRLDPTNANAAYELGELERKLGQLDKARERFESALSHDPDFEEAHLGLSRVLIDLGAPGPALPHLKKAIELNRRSEVAYYRLSQVHKALGNAAEQQKALAEFQRLRGQKAQRDALQLHSSRDVTKQQDDPEPKP
ncbi:MAG: tetratricopeptide repeat protein [Acidobacteria bacterium]|nr:tetratricopeptide repeat protein [Acidobacteriota bacterium]